MSELNTKDSVGIVIKGATKLVNLTQRLNPVDHGTGLIIPDSFQNEPIANTIVEFKLVFMFTVTLLYAIATKCILKAIWKNLK